VAHFYGPYELTPKGYAAVEEWLKQHPDKVAAGPNTSYDIYIGDPGVEKDPYKVLTDIVFPLK
jgi:effector-binding domain-containing protein